jgi:hypothetical protein
MSAFHALLSVLGWESPAEKKSQWGKRPPVKLSDRRSSPRYPASPNEGYMGWWVGEEFHTVAVQFRDFSLGGALILTREMPPSEHIWLGLAKPSETPWCPVNTVRVKETSVGLVEVALLFPEPCDYDLFKAVVYGDYAKERPICNSPEFRDRDWR